MDYREFTPAPSLVPYVRCYWTLRAPAPGGPAAQRVLPDGCVEMVINLGDIFTRLGAEGGVERQPRMLLVGPTTRHMVIEPTGVIDLVGVRFAPGGALPFLTLPPRELRDLAPALDEVALVGDPCLAERLAGAPDGARPGILDDALSSRLRRARRTTDSRVRSSVHFALAAARSARVDNLVALTGIGVRQLERRFLENVGFGPKTLCRLARFQKVVRAVEPNGVRSWARLAAHAGYADQPHMAREFREFAGTTLSEYARELHPMSDRFHSVTGAEPLPD